MSLLRSTYVVFNADPEKDSHGNIKGDMRYYGLLLGWKERNEIDFDFNNAHDLNNIRKGSLEESIKRQLRERMKYATDLVVILGPYTKYQRRFVLWEIEIAQSKGIPIIVANTSKKRQLDDTQCPSILNDSLAVHVAFEAKILSHAMKNWPAEHNRRKNSLQTGWRYYPDDVYKQFEPKARQRTLADLLYRNKEI